MNYQRIYNQLMIRANDELELRIQKKSLGDYFEGHHIIPRCLNGQGKSSNFMHPNITLLTAREHFLAHWLLHRIYPDNNKIAHAFWQMCSWKRSYQYRITPNSRIYQEAKESIAKIVSKRFTGRALSIEHKKKIGDFWRGKKRNKEFGLKISAAQKGREGTHKGWITVTNGEFEKRIKSIDECPIGWKRGRKNAVRESISLTQTGTILSDKTRQKMSDAKKGKTPWNKGLRNKLN